MSKLYLDEYCVFGGGATATDLHAMYLTNKKDFNLYLGVEDEGDMSIVVKCNGDTILVEKLKNTTAMQEWNFPIVTQRKIYSLSKLKQDHIFN